MCHRLVRMQRGVGSLHSTLKCICEIRRQLAEWEEWPELLAFLWGSKRHKRSLIIPCWNKSDTDTAVGGEKRRGGVWGEIIDWSQGTNTSFKVETCDSGEPCIQ